MEIPYRRYLSKPEDAVTNKRKPGALLRAYRFDLVEARRYYRKNNKSAAAKVVQVGRARTIGTLIRRWGVTRIILRHNRLIEKVMVRVENEEAPEMFGRDI